MSWSTHQLVEFMAVVSRLTEAEETTLRAVERVADALEAEVCALSLNGEIAASIGFRSGQQPEAQILDAMTTSRLTYVFDGLGECTVAAVPVGPVGERLGGVLVARLGRVPFSDDEIDLLRGMGRVFGLEYQRVQGVQERRSIENKLRHAQRLAGLGSWHLELASGVATWSPELLRITGFDRSATFEDYLHCIHFGDAEWVTARIDSLREQQEPFRIQHRIVRSDGVTRIVTARGEVVDWRAGAPHAIGGTLRDVTDQVRHAKSLATQLGVVRALADSANVEIALPRVLAEIGAQLDLGVGFFWQSDGASLILSASWHKAASLASLVEATRTSDPQATHELAGLELVPAEPIMDRIDTLDTDDRSRLAAALGLRYRLLVPVTAGTAVVGLLEFFTPSKDIDRTLGGSLTTIGNQVGQFIAHKRSEARIAHDALHDALTGLPNRSLFFDRLKHAIDCLTRHPGSIAVLFVDVDDFKRVNDGLGHRAGDELLRSVGQRFERCVEQSGAVCTVARFGGDEFVILAEGLRQDEDVIDIASLVVETMESPFTVGQNQVEVQCSIGITTTSRRDADPETLIRQADLAMYEAKQDSHIRYHLFDQSMMQRFRERLRIESGLRSALEDGHLRVFYQPVVALPQQELIGFEALVRWVDPERGLISPGHFIEVAEESGLIEPLGEWVLRTSCRRLGAWIREFEHCGSLRMSVNVSPRQFHRGLIELVTEILGEDAIDPERLVLEITESILVRDEPATLNLIHELRSLGVRLALDDFGTGYSALKYLSDFRFDVLKLDRSLIAGIAEKQRQRDIVRTTADLARSLGLDLVAEGVETPEQLALLNGLRCPYAQGFLFGRPLSEDAATRYLYETRRRRTNLAIPPVGRETIGTP